MDLSPRLVVYRVPVGQRESCARALSVRVRSALGIVLCAAAVAVGCGKSTSETNRAAHAAGNTPEQNKQIARKLIGDEYPQWDNATQFRCLDRLWQAESHWNHRARNKRTGACGIPQAYPCSKMADWGKAYGVSHTDNPWPQIAWGLSYIERRYGSPCRAWKRFQRGGGY